MIMADSAPVSMSSSPSGSAEREHRTLVSFIIPVRNDAIRLFKRYLEIGHAVALTS